MSDKNVYFCPQCGSATVTYSLLEGSSFPATCRGCNWRGSSLELLGVPMRNDLSDEMLVSIVNDMRQLLSGTLGLPYLKFLLKWGFLQGDIARVTATVDRKQFARYLAAIGHGVIVALMKERERMALEESKGEESATHGSA